jgi:hypothetical protein
VSARNSSDALVGHPKFRGDGDHFLAPRHGVSYGSPLPFLEPANLISDWESPVPRKSAGIRLPHPKPGRYFSQAVAAKVCR